MRKKLVLWAAVLVFALACGMGVCLAEEEKLTVIATIFPPYDFVREIAGDQVNLKMLLKPGAEVHTFEPTPKDIMAIQDCDLFIYVGGESDAWVKDMLSSMPSQTRRDVALMDLVTLKEDITPDGVHGHGEEEYDEHVWTSPVNAMAIVSALSEELCALDADNESLYRENAAAYVDELKALDEAFRDVVESAPSRELVFGDRFPLTYFVREYGLTYDAAFPGCASETEPSAATVARLIQKIDEDHIPVVFYIELSNHSMADALAEQTGARAEMFYTCHNVTADDFDAGVGYLELMSRDVPLLKEALARD